jgi:hypothetical protein
MSRLIDTLVKLEDGEPLSSLTVDVVRMITEECIREMNEFESIHHMLYSANDGDNE